MGSDRWRAVREELYCHNAARQRGTHMVVMSLGPSIPLPLTVDSSW